MVHVPLMFLSEWREFPSAPCLAGKKNLMTARVSMLLKSRASPDVLPFSLCKKKRLAIRHINRPPLSNDTIDSVQRLREVGRANDISRPPRNLLALKHTNNFVPQFCVYPPVNKTSTSLISSHYFHRSRSSFTYYCFQKEMGGSPGNLPTM